MQQQFPYTKNVGEYSFFKITIMPYLKNITENWKAGLTVALLSTPVSIALAVGSQANPTSGIIATVVACFIAGLIGSNKFTILGPTASLAGLLAACSINHGFQSLAMVTVTAGILILLVYFFGLEKYIKYIPISTIQGFGLGIALTIILDQINFALDLRNLPSHISPVQNIKETFAHIHEFSMQGIILFTLFLGLLFIWRKLVPNTPSIMIMFPLGLLVGVASYFQVLPLDVQMLGQKFPFPREFHLPQLYFSVYWLNCAFAVALIAIIETMQTCYLADSLTHTHSDESKKLFTLGLANIVSGLLGGIPATASSTRTKVNIRSGATDKTSKILCAFFVILISLLFLPWCAYLPMPIMAAILVFASERLIEREQFVQLFKRSKKEFWISMLVAALVLIRDPFTAILVGTAITLLVIQKKDFTQNL